MTIRPSSDPAPQAAQVAAWLRARAPEPPPADLVGRIVLTTEGRRPDPAWLARRRGHHLATRTPGPPRTGWIPVVALLVLSGSVAAVVATGGASIDERAVIVVPPAPPTDSSRVMASPSPTRSPSPTQLPLGPIAKSVRYEEFDALGLLVLVPTDAQHTVASDRVTFDRPYSATIRLTVGDRAQGAAFQPPSGTEQRFWAPTSVNALDGLHRIGVRVRSVDSSVVDGEPAVVVTAEEQGPTALVVHRGRLYVIASVGPRAIADPLTALEDLDDVLGRIDFVDPITTANADLGFELTYPDPWSFDGEEITPGPGRAVDVSLKVSVATLGGDGRVLIGRSNTSVAVPGADLDDVVRRIRATITGLGAGRETVIAGEPAMRWRLTRPMSVDDFAVVVHRDRVYVLSETVTPFGSSTRDPGYLDQIIAGFRFR